MKTFESYYAFLMDMENETGYQVYDQRTDKDGVHTPYIVCQRITNNDFYADNKRYLKRDQISVILHTYQANHTLTGEKVEAEKKIEDYLDKCGVLFDRDDDWLDDIQLYAISYGIEIVYVS